MRSIPVGFLTGFYPSLSYSVGRRIRNANPTGVERIFFLLCYYVTYHYNNHVMRLEKIALILHFYQPSIQTQNQFKQIFESSYLPLLRLIKSKKNCRFTFNIPLSFLELADRYGYSTWLADLAKLYEQGSVELTGTGAYHPILNTMPRNLATDEIILQEYGLGFYFGKHTGFDGEKEILIRDIAGFFPPELAVNNELCSILSELNYKWVLADACSVDEVSFPLVQHSSHIFVLLRNTILSNMLAFHRGFDTRELYSALKGYNHEHLVLALDAETFGHHNHEGVTLLDILLDQLVAQSVSFDTASNLVEELSYVKGSIEIRDVYMSSWGATAEEVLANNPLPIWQSATNELQIRIWELFTYIYSTYTSQTSSTELPIHANSAFWKPEVLARLDAELRHSVETKFMAFKILASDFLWWASGKTLSTGQFLMDKDILRKYLTLTKTYAAHTNDDTIRDFVERIEELL